MAKLYDFQWQIAVPETLLQGASFDRWEEVRDQKLVFGPRNFNLKVTYAPQSISYKYNYWQELLILLQYIDKIFACHCNMPGIKVPNTVAFALCCGVIRYMYTVYLIKLCCFSKAVQRKLIKV